MAKKIGRPSKYKPEYDDQAYRLALLGLTDAEIARFFDVTEQTVNNWKIEHPSFFESLTRGKAPADADVAAKLYHRALGYSHEAVKIFADPKTGAEKIVPYTEHYPPDPTSAIFWLKNRQPQRWRDRHELVTLTPEQVAGLSDEQLAAILAGKPAEEVAKPN